MFKNFKISKEFYDLLEDKILEYGFYFSVDSLKTGVKQ
ncbi:hypothetical protein BAZMOX_00523_2 [methanotrophic endosymbiont of Bathymodiolus azoricus (Menez Gwen)]|nr:hypothetical protein BAZMOX_00523_2 [methanotrophic endosymbiont of Bathymodiolus azoricus (Menez Gwen)]